MTYFIIDTPRGRKVAVNAKTYPHAVAIAGTMDNAPDPDAPARVAPGRQTSVGQPIPAGSPGCPPLSVAGDATYYDLPGHSTAAGAPFDGSRDGAAMFGRGARIGDVVRVRRTEPPYNEITLQVNDRGPFARGSDGKALRPLQPDPRGAIDLTPYAFRRLTGGRKAGRVPVIVTRESCRP